jgi:hypothetical protein
MNFELLPIMTDYAIRKKGDEIKKKSSPLKLLSQSQPNFAEMMPDTYLEENHPMTISSKFCSY